MVAGATIATDPYNAATRVYRNDAGTFIATNSNFAGMKAGSSTWGDYDQDGDLDLLVTGTNDSSYVETHFYTNNRRRDLNGDDVYEGITSNATPDVPTDLTATVSGSQVILSWNGAGDDSTPPQALSYNVRVGTTAGGNEVVTPMSVGDGESDGRRQVVRYGNAGQRMRLALNGLESDSTYYWSVQAVDNTFAGSPFSAEQSFSKTILNQAPTASFSVSPDSGIAPLAVSLDASESSDPDGTISYAWNFGDGKSASGRTAEHSYEEAGEYVATLTVVDDDSTAATARDTINVIWPFEADFRVASSRSSSYDAEITVTNNTSTPADNWILEFDLNATITKMRGATYTESSHHYTVEGKGKDRAIAVGDSVSFTFSASYSDAIDEPTGCTLSGQSCTFSDDGEASSASISSSSSEMALPDEFELGAAYPNPFNSLTHIQYALPAPAHVRLEVYDVLGRRVDVLVDEEQSAGYYRVTLNGKSLASGLYVYRMQAGSFRETGKVVLVR